MWTFQVLPGHPDTGVVGYVVDPSIDADSGTGTLGDPFGDYQYCLDTITRDGVAGDDIHVKAGTAEVLTAPIDLSTYGTPTASAPLRTFGFTTTPLDGGHGEIDGDGASVFESGISHVHFEDMTLGNCGSDPVLILGESNVTDCEIENTTGDGIVLAQTGATLKDITYTSISGADVKTEFDVPAETTVLLGANKRGGKQ